MRELINIFIVFGIFVCVFGKGDPIVETKAGKVAGLNKVSLVQKKEYFSFYGIPYAEPPLGDLRFMPPRPKGPWEEVWDAKKRREECAQFSAHGRGKNVGFYGDEDCLYLNVHTPSIEREEPLPVIVYTTSQNFRSSKNVSKSYSPDFFMEEGILIVTFAHRLGVIGFLSFEDDLLPGNNGLRDIILVLEWVKENIRFFGGDPNKVTLMGSNSGAAAADLLLYSEKAKGLFNGVILQSGTSWNPLFLEANPKKSAISLASILDKKVSTSEALIKSFKKVKAKHLTEMDVRVRQDENSREIQRGLIPFGPCVEHEHPDAVLTTHPENSTFRIDVPIMIGLNSREGIEFCARYLRQPQFLTYADRDFMFYFPIRVKFHFKFLHEIYMDAENKIKDFYFDEGYVKVSKPGEYITYSSDIINTYSIDYTVRRYVNTTQTPIYYYIFDYSGKLNREKNHVLSTATTLDGTWGASLGDELCYLFLCNNIRKNYKEILENPESFNEVKVLRRMVRMWSNFAKTGNPTPDHEDDILKDFKWERASNDGRILEISKDLKMRTNPAAGRIKFWDNFLEKYEKLAVDGIVKNKHILGEDYEEKRAAELADAAKEAPIYKKYVQIVDGENVIDRNIEEQEQINEEFARYNARRKATDEDDSMENIEQDNEHEHEYWKVNLEELGGDYQDSNEKYADEEFDLYFEDEELVNLVFKDEL